MKYLPPKQPARSPSSPQNLYALNFPVAFSPLITFWVVTFWGKRPEFLPPAAEVGWDLALEQVLTGCLPSILSLTEGEFIGRFHCIRPWSFLRWQEGLTGWRTGCWRGDHLCGSFVPDGPNPVPSPFPQALGTHCSPPRWSS